MLTARADHPRPPRNPARTICDDILEDVRRALYVYRAEQKWDWNDVLQYNASFQPDPQALLKEYRESCAGKEWMDRATAEAVRRLRGAYPAPPEKDLLFGVLRPHRRGAYCVVLREDPSGPDRLFAIITGISDEETVCTIRASLEYSEATYAPRAGLHAHGGVVIGGSTKLDIAAVDGDLHLSGTPSISTAVLATGEVLISGEFAAPQTVQRGPGAVPIVPEIVPEVYRPLADYILDRRGCVRTRDDEVLADVCRKEPWHGAAWNAARGWSIRGAPDLPAATYFVEGNLRILFTDETERVATFVATGSVILEGSLRFRPKQTGTLVLAGGDLVVNGASGSELHGVLAAGEQARIGGGGTVLNGALIVHDGADLYAEVIRNRTGGKAVCVRVGGGTAIDCSSCPDTIIKAPLHSIRLNGLELVH
jgi:hypothetical protein